MVKKYSYIYILDEKMIDYNKYEHPQVKNISANLATKKIRARSNKKIKLTDNNKAFLKAIGLLK